MISLAEDVRDIAGWPEIEWGMSEEEVREVLAGRVSAIRPVARFANSYAPIKGSLTIETYPFEVFPQFSHASGELCQVLFRAAAADAGCLARVSELLTARYGRPLERGTKRTWWGPTGAVELDTVERPADGAPRWLRWYPVHGTAGG